MSGAVIGGRYELRGTLGQGGMGDVYLGVVRPTGEQGAITLPNPDIVDASPELIERFEREGEALRRLNHPNIVKMLAMVEEEGLHYLVMQYVSGGSLRDLLDAQPQLPLNRVLSIALELADALTRAHHLHIIHRDLKPANVLLDESGSALLTDFGVAHMGGHTRVTETGSVIGTYAYLSPEACRGEPLDARADIWSFGVLLFEMLAGRRPFDAEQSTAVLLSIIHDAPPDLASLRPDTPPALVALIEGMLRKDRDERTPSVRVVGAALEAIQQGDESPLPVTPSRAHQAKDERSRFSTPTPPSPDATSPAVESPALASVDDLVRVSDTGTRSSSAAPPAAAPLAAAASRRRPWPLIALAAVVIVGVLAAALWAALNGGDSGQMSAADWTASAQGATQAAAPVHVAPVGPGEMMVLVARFEPLEGASERDVARFVVEDLTERLERGISFSNVRIREYPRVITQAADALAAAEANGAPVIVWGNYTASEVEARVQIGSIAGFPHIPVARDVLERTANVRLALNNERRDSVALPVLAALNVLLTAEGDTFGVAHNIAMVIALEPEPPDVLNAGVSRILQSAIVAYHADTPGAIDLYTGALALDEGNPLLYLYRASAYMRVGQMERALQDIESAQRRVPGDWASPLMLLVNHAIAQYDWESAAARCTQILDGRPDDWFAYNYRGVITYMMGDYDRARSDLEQAVALGARANFPYITLSVIALREGRLADAQDYWTTMVERYPDATFSTRISQAMYGDEFPNIFSPMLAAVGSVALGQYNTAIEAAEKALALIPTLSDMYVVLGLSWCSLDNYPAAEQAYSRAIALDPNLVLAYALRAEAWLRMGEIARAWEDRAIVEQSGQASAFVPVMEAGLRGEWSCKQFFGYDYAALLNAASEDSSDD